MPDSGDEEAIAPDTEVSELDDIKNQLADLQKKLAGLN
jgi:hypothetical protein